MRYPRGVPARRTAIDRLFKGINTSADRIQLAEIGERNKIRYDVKRLAGLARI
jgi:hypothetical protein